MERRTIEGFEVSRLAKAFTTMNRSARVSQNLAEIRDRIAIAAQESGRSGDDVTLVAVTKYVDAATTQLVADAGCLDLGENRPQQLWQKAEELGASPIRWHQIGHMQRNKLARTIPLIELLHSVDSLRLLAAVDELCGKQQIKLRSLIEVNVTQDADKHGFAPSEIPPLIGELSNYTNVQIEGFMCMASLAGEPDDARREFASLRELRDSLLADCPENVRLDQLSMGMSRDYELAIQEGATIVRVGSAVFEGVAS